MHIEGEVNHRRVLGKHIAFCRLKGIEFEIIFKSKELEEGFSFPSSKSKLPLGATLRVFIEKIGEDHVVKTWEIIKPSTLIKKRMVTEIQNMEQILCKRWTLEKSCDQESCKYRHYFMNDEEVEAAKRRKVSREQFLERDAKLLAEYHKEDPFGSDKSHKNKRAGIFVDWLVSTFGAENLQKGCGVVDIAGGGGDIAKILMKKNIQCTVIDPVRRKKQKLLDNKGSLGYKQIEACFTEQSANEDEDQKAFIENASLLVGLHADQPTVDIVKVALAQNKNFAVVPCCVFTNLFPDRKLPSGESVNTTEQLCQFICAMNHCIQTTFLPFCGRNKVCYTIKNTT